jgi:NAD(P)-dependent dehydrogenase (short-subunit alcohol dehydrogenase family)
VIADIDISSGQAAASAIQDRGGRALFVPADAAEVEDAERVAHEAEGAFGGIDVLVNNAGVQPFGSLLETSEDDWDACMKTNVRSVFTMSKRCVPRMLERGSSAIVNVASTQALAAYPGLIAYSASKGAVVALTRAMAVELAPAIRVNSVCPGATDTPLLRRASVGLNSEEEAVAALGESYPMGRVAAPLEIAEVIAFLSGPHASFVTGSCYVADGGVLSIIRGS